MTPNTKKRKVTFILPVEQHLEIPKTGKNFPKSSDDSGINVKPILKKTEDYDPVIVSEDSFVTLSFLNSIINKESSKFILSNIEKKEIAEEEYDKPTNTDSNLESDKLDNTNNKEESKIVTDTDERPSAELHSNLNLKYKSNSKPHTVKDIKENKSPPILDSGTSTVTLKNPSTPLNYQEKENSSSFINRKSNSTFNNSNKQIEPTSIIQSSIPPSVVICPILNKLNTNHTNSVSNKLLHSESIKTSSPINRQSLNSSNLKNKPFIKLKSVNTDYSKSCYKFRDNITVADPKVFPALKSTEFQSFKLKSLSRRMADTNVEEDTLTPNMRDDIKEKTILIWIYNMIDEPARVDFEFFLKDGCILCTLMNRINPGCIKEEDITWEGARSKQKNIAMFLECAENYGVPKSKLFQLEDLLHLRHIPRVTRCIYALAKIAENDPALGEDCPRLGDEPNFATPSRKVDVPGHRDTKEVLNQITSTVEKKDDKKILGRQHSLYQ